MSFVFSYPPSAIRHQLLKIFLILLTLTTYFLILNTASASAQTPATPSAMNYQPITNNQYIPSTSPNIATKAIYDFGHAISCILGGSSPIGPCLEYKFTKNLSGVVSGTPYLSSVNTSGGLLGMGGSMIAMLYQEKPLDQMSFMTYLGRNIGLVKEANAQVGGSGNQVLSPIFALWTVSRNVAYLIMILVFIVIGLMVMFRQKLNPQTVVTAQMAIPGLVIGLILITFSYFIAALITDMAYVGTDLVGYYFDEAIKINGGTPASNSLAERLSNESAVSIGAGSSSLLDKKTIEEAIQQLWDKLPSEPGAGAIPIVGGAINSIATYWDITWVVHPRGVVRFFAGALTYLMYNSFLGPVADIGGGAVGTIGGLLSKLGRTEGLGRQLSAAGVLLGGTATPVAAAQGFAALQNPVGYLAYWASILAILIMLYTIVKLFFRLINCYLSIIFSTIASPFIFLASSIPGRQGMVTDWLRNLLCNVLAFPAVIAVFYFAAFLVGSNGGHPIPVFGVDKELNLTNATGNLPFLGGLSLDFLRKILAFVAILATPSIPDVICQTVGKPGRAGSVLAGAVGGAIAGGQRYEGQISGQVQKAGSDMGTWSNAMFGSRLYSGGRLGMLQAKVQQIDSPDLYTDANAPKIGDISAIKNPFWRRVAQTSRYFRKQQVGTRPQDVQFREVEAEKNPNQNPY